MRYDYDISKITNAHPYQMYNPKIDRYITLTNDVEQVVLTTFALSLGQVLAAINADNSNNFLIFGENSTENISKTCINYILDCGRSNERWAEHTSNYMYFGNVFNYVMFCWPDKKLKDNCSKYLNPVYITLSEESI